MKQKSKKQLKENLLKQKRKNNLLIEKFSKRVENLRKYSNYMLLLLQVSFFVMWGMSIGEETNKIDVRLLIVPAVLMVVICVLLTLKNITISKKEKHMQLEMA